jgi:hypothetical protein
MDTQELLQAAIFDLALQQHRNHQKIAAYGSSYKGGACSNTKSFLSKRPLNTGGWAPSGVPCKAL